MISVQAPAYVYLLWPERNCNSVQVHSSFEPSPSPSTFLSADLDGLSKSWPKMDMARIKSEEQPESETRQLVCTMINQDRSLKDLLFIISEISEMGTGRTMGVTNYIGLGGETTLLNKIRNLDFFQNYSHR